MEIRIKKGFREVIINQREHGGYEVIDSVVNPQGIIVREKEDVVRMFEQMLRTPYQ